MEIVDYGFQKAGIWELWPRIRSGVRFVLEALADERVVYAFDVDSVPKYIGVCEESDTTLADRMNRYKSMAGAGQNRRVAGEIHKALGAGRAVGIHALKPDEGFVFKGLPIDLVKGLENPLLEAFVPEWNLRK